MKVKIGKIHGSYGFLSNSMGFPDKNCAMMIPTRVLSKLELHYLPKKGFSSITGPINISRWEPSRTTAVITPSLYKCEFPLIGVI